MAKFGLWTKADSILTTQAQAKVDILARRGREAFVEGEFFGGKSLHPKIE